MNDLILHPESLRDLSLHCIGWLAQLTVSVLSQSANSVVINRAEELVRVLTASQRTGARFEIPRGDEEEMFVRRDEQKPQTFEATKTWNDK